MSIQTIDPFPGHYLDDDPFGSMEDRRYPHTGSDWGRSIGGQWIPAPAAGVVVAVGFNAGNGNYVCWRLENGLHLAALHLAELSPLSVGDRVELGQGVGVVGATGSNANGPHLHLTLSDSPLAYLGLGNKQDPWAFIQAHLLDLTALLNKGEEMAKQTLVVRDLEGDDPYFVTDGIYRRQLVAGEDVLLEQAGLIDRPADKPGRVHVVGDLVDRLIDAGRAIDLIEYFHTKKG